MTEIKLKSTYITGRHQKHPSDYSHIDLADDPKNSGTFATVWADIDGEKGRELVKRWNEHPELVAAAKCALAALSQNATFPADIALAKQALIDAIAKAKGGAA